MFPKRICTKFMTLRRVGSWIFEKLRRTYMSLILTHISTKDRLLNLLLSASKPRFKQRGVTSGLRKIKTIPN